MNETAALGSLTAVRRSIKLQGLAAHPFANITELSLCVRLE
jgi:hypothetical protein